VAFQFKSIATGEKLFHDEVEVNLRPTVSRPVCPGVRRPSGTCDQFFFAMKFPVDSCGFVIYMSKEILNPVLKGGKSSNHLGTRL
jgi:hypothetical protein